MTRYAIGLDYGTNSCRSLIVNLENGAEVASHVYPYPSGQMGVIVDPRDPNVARQNPADYRSGLIAIVVEGLKKAHPALCGTGGGRGAVAIREALYKGDAETRPECRRFFCPR